MDESIDIIKQDEEEDSYAGNSSHSDNSHISDDMSQSNNTSHSESTIEIVYPDSESNHSSKHKSPNNTYDEDEEDSFAGNDDLNNSNKSSEEEFVISEEEIDGENSLNDSEFDEDIEIADYSQRGGFSIEEESELELLGLRRRGNGSTRYSQLYNNEEELGISRLDSQGSTSIYDATNKNDLELNPNYGKVSKADELREQIADLPLITTSTAEDSTTASAIDVHDGAYDTNSGSLDDETKLEDFVLDHDKAVSHDPPIQDTSEHSNLLDPDDENKSLFSRLDCPPSPAGPEKNKIKGYQRQSSKGSSTKGSSIKGNSKEDDGGRELALVEDEVSKMSIRGQDPPESGRGCDPKPKGNSGGSSHKHRGGGSRGSGGSKSSRSKGGSKSRRSREESCRRDRKKKQPEIKGILKKKGAPIPITQFGKPLTPTQDDSDEDSFAGNSSQSSGSDPDISECKQTTTASVSTTTLQLGSSAPPNGDDDSIAIKSVGTAKSGGLRSGKYATVNQMAAWKQGEDNDSDDDEEGDHTYTGVSELTPYSGADGDFNSHSDFEGNYKYDAKGKPIKRHNSDDDGDDDGSTLQSIATNTNTHFDRSKSHFLRTADLGLTQDTIFAEQFLDDANQKVEPHYHIPSLHPPPGVQFHIDENWVCLDDGKGSHSPIAPQAVDALVAMGYRAACDPMMWTPTSKTRKYMTEKKLRFDDMPIPGPLDEGDGGVDDTTGVGVWSGKFPHKYHGYEQPAIRSQGIVNMSPEELVDLLMDSSRVSEYNKSSIGRVDEVVLSDGTNLDSCPFSGQRKKKLTGVVVQGAKVVNGTAVFDSETDDEGSDEEIEETIFDEHGTKSVRMITATSSKKEQRQSNFIGVTKLVRTTNKPPLVRKVLEFFTLLHCRALTDDQGGDGYIIVGRGIIPAADADSDKKGVMHSEILLNVHIIRRLRPVSSSKKSRDKKSKGGSRSRSVSESGRKASKSDLANRCLLINVNHLKSPLVPNMLAKKVGLSAAVNFITDIRALTE